MIPLNTVYCMDCLEGMKMLEDNSVDLILTDPPYGINLEYEDYKDTPENWFKLMNNMIPEMLRVSKMIIMPCCQIARLEWIYKKYPPNWLICWYKGSTGHRSYIGFNDWEPLLVYGKLNTNMHDYMKVTPTRFNNGHPCPKPIKWARWIIKRATKEEDIVCDPFAGSGTILAVANQLNRRWIGFEISSNYCEVIKEKLSQKGVTNFFKCSQKPSD